LIIIAATAAALSIFSYQYSDFFSSQAAKVSDRSAQTNAKVEAHDLGRILARSIDAVTSNLMVISSSQPVQNHDQSAQSLLDSAQRSTSDLTEFYMWLDKDGKLVELSNLNYTQKEKYQGTDLSYRPYFTEPRKSHSLYFSSAIDSRDNIARLYVSYPIMVNGNAANSTGTFDGVVVSGVRLTLLGTFLKNELSPEFASTAGLLDRNGTILYTDNQTFIGSNVFGSRFQSLLPAAIKDPFNNLLRQSLEGKSGYEDISYNGQTGTIAYEPVLADGNYFATLYIVTPHKLTTEVALLADQQRTLSTLIVVTIGAVAVGLAFLVVTWNKRLMRTVSERTTELQRANEQLKVHDKMQKEFINIAAHELRTPTQAILGYSELLESEMTANDVGSNGKAEMVDALRRNALRLQRLTSDILDVTRIESNTLKLNKERVDLNEKIKNVAKDMKHEIPPGKDVEIVAEPSEKEIFVMADRTRIYEVMANLVKNAVKFTDHGKIIISAEKNEKDNEAIVRVKDSGTGIDRDMIPRLFTKFATKSDQGTGLGLFISKNVVEAHGGQIWGMNNKDGSGATFSFSLPLAGSQKQEKESSISSAN